MKKITLQDIAKELGISKGTVDRAIHNRPDVNPDTRKKVLELIEKYEYKPDKVARSLSLKAKKVRIGVIYQKRPEFFWNNIKKGILAAEVELADFGLQVLYRELNKNRQQNEIINYIDELVTAGVDAIALVPVNNPTVKQKINETCEKGIAVITLNDDITDSNRVFYVGPQMRQSGRLAGELTGKFLRGKGRVLTINGSIQSLEYQERFEGFKEVIEGSYSGINIIANYTCDFEGMLGTGEGVIQSILENTGEIDAIYDVDGATLYNVGKIIKNSSKLTNIVLVGHEIWDGVKELMADGIIDACISQDPYSQGYFMVKLLFDYLVEGKKPQYTRMYTRLDVILKESIITEDNIINPYYIEAGGI